jgi:sugar-specific transcriptional regulator TrmB
MKYQNALERIGLKKDEATVYEVLLENGPLSVLKLSYKSEIHRPGLYSLLPKMINKGLISQIKKGKRVEYIATSPNHLEHLVEAAKNNIENIVNNLNTEFSKKQIVPKVEMYYGVDGIRRIFVDIVTTLNNNDTYYRYTMRKDLNKDYLPKFYRQIRDNKKLERLVITSDQEISRYTAKLDRFVKVINGNYELFNISKFIYQNKIAYIDYENEIAFIIYHEKMAQLEKKIFLSLFKIL